MYLYIQGAAAAAAILYCCTAVVAAAPAAVRHRVPGGKQRFWFTESGSIQCFLSLQTRFIFNEAVFCL